VVAAAACAAERTAAAATTAGGTRGTACEVLLLFFALLLAKLASLHGLRPGQHGSKRRNSHQAQSAVHETHTLQPAVPHKSTKRRGAEQGARLRGACGRGPRDAARGLRLL
jgi:hypothetical protein